MRPICSMTTWIAIVATLLLTSPPIQAIGPQSVLVITTAKSPQGLAAANYYRQKRGLPPINIVRMRVEPTDRMNPDVFQRTVAEVALSHIQKYGLENKISVWATTVDLPTIIAPDNSISGTIYFGDRMPTSNNPVLKGAFDKDNTYFDKILGYRRTGGTKLGGFLHMRIDAGSLAETQSMIDRSIQADGSFPRGTIYLFDGEGPRNVRKEAIPSAQRFINMLDLPVDHRMVGSLNGATDVIGWQTGVPSLIASQNRYLPGALADHLTSFGGSMNPKHNQTCAIDFLKAGCSATYGTVVEPYNHLAKFPVPHLYGYYGLGFTAVESYWMSVRWPQQGLFMGDPLTRPFEKPISIDVERLRAEEIVKGTIDFDVAAEVLGPGAGIRGIEINIGNNRIHQRGFAEVPAGTKVTCKLWEKTIEYTSVHNLRLGDMVGMVAKELAQAGYQLSTKPGMIILLPPPGTSKADVPTVVSSSPILRVEVLGQNREPNQSLTPTPPSADIQWKLEGTSGEGDRLVLTLREDGKEVAKIDQQITFARPASSLCTSLYIEANKSLPTGYKLEPVLDPSRADTGALKLLADPKRALKKVTATLDHFPKPDSKLVVQGAGTNTALAATGSSASSPIGIRFGLGPAKLRTKPVVDTTKFPDGRIKLVILSARGGATDSSTLMEWPIVISNKKSRIKLTPLTTNMSASQPGKVNAAKIVAPSDLPGHVRFLIDDNHVSAIDVSGDTLAIEPSFWGEGSHEITAEWVEGTTVIQRADNFISLNIAP
jgi:uncharacterized protein (TIGR03790 family)